MMRKIFLAALLCMGAFSARADIIPSLTTPADVTPVGGGNFSWNYSSTVTQDERVQTGDYFTIYDFSGYVAGGNTQPAGWTFSAALIGVTPSRVSPMDDPTLFNLTWTYTGTTTLDGPQALGVFSAIANTDLAHIGEFTAEATRAVGDPNGTKVDNIGNVVVPVPEVSTLIPVLGICSFAAFGVARSLARSKQH